MSERVRYYVVIDGVTRGPYSLFQLRCMWKDGQITEETQYAEEGGDVWLHLRVLEDELEGAQPFSASNIPNRSGAIDEELAMLRRGGTHVCTVCRTVMIPKKTPQGQSWVELVLWFLMCIPGLIYSLWRVSSERIMSCSVCGSEAVVPMDSPMGRQLTSRRPTITP